MASRYDGRGDTPTITRRRHVLACARCRARRVKCDRAQPACSNCAKAGALCQPAQQQQLAPPPSTGSSRTGKRDPNDKLRLSKLEEEVARLSRGLDSKSPSREPSVPGSPVDTDAGWSSQNQGKIWYGNQTRYFGPASWASVPDEVADIRTILGESDSGVFESVSEPTGTSPLDSSSSESEMELPLPNDQLHETLLNLYSHRVDPLVRILHWPSFLEQSRAFRRRKAAKLHAAEGTTFSNAYYADPTFDPSQQRMYSSTSIVPSQDHEQIPGPRSLAAFDQGFTALIYSVYYAAVVSVIDSPNPPDLGGNINAFSLAATFKREVTNRVMSLDAKVARSESLQMLQAMVLHLSVEPSSFDSQLQWLQLGAAIRLAQSLGVHRDGSQFDLRPIECETRRRLWAQICVLDTRIGEHLGREPTISIDTYDTALPLSISDSDLSEIDEHDAASRRGKETNFKTYQEIEQGLERHSPFSPMTFSLVETESARMMAQLSTRRLRPRDSIFQSQLSRSNSIARSEQSHWINRFEHRFRTVYDVDSLDSSSPMQYLVAEMINLIILRAKFTNNLLQWREAYGRMEDARRDAERDELLRAAVVISIRSLTLIHQYSSTPYGWYTKRLRDVYASSFLAILLASGEDIEPELTNSSWSVLSQLFPVDETGRLVEAAIAGSVLGKVLQKARMRQLRVHNPQDIRQQSMHPAAGASQPAYPMALTSTSVQGMSSFQSSGNLFEDFDALMQEPLWSAGLPGAENPFGNWAVNTPQGSPLQVPIRPRSQPFEQPYPTPAAQRPQTYIATHTPNSHLQVTIDSGDEMTSKELHQRSLSHSSQANFPNPTPHIVHSPMPPQESHMILDGPITQEPVQHGHLQLPNLRTRSISQPQPINMKGWGQADPKGLILTPISPGQESLRPHSYYGHGAVSPYSTPSPTMRPFEEPFSPMPLKISLTS